MVNGAASIRRRRKPFAGRADLCFTYAQRMARSMVANSRCVGRGPASEAGTAHQYAQSQLKLLRAVRSILPFPHVKELQPAAPVVRGRSPLQMGYRVRCYPLIQVYHPLWKRILQYRLIYEFLVIRQQLSLESADVVVNSINLAISSPSVALKSSERPAQSISAIQG